VDLPKGRSGGTLDRPHTPRPQTDGLSIAQLRDLLPVPVAACEEAGRLLLAPGDRSDGGRRDLRRTTSGVTSSTVELRGSSGGCWRHRLHCADSGMSGFSGEEHGGDDTLLVVRPSGRVAEPLSRAQGMGVMLPLIERGQPVQCVIHLPPAGRSPSTLTERQVVQQRGS
jgi:hypothetical protein